ncbi:MAG: Gfo/Idh/MocA family oxidoreductase [Pirellulales bacterium]|nr:Gfo/Idh/MocA family oxidoreductase [Pirellulales bacterium]
MTMKTSRRTFLQGAALAGTVGPWILSSRSFGAEGRKLRHASIGVGRRGDGDLRCFLTHPDIEVVALCDVDRSFLEAAAKLVPGARLYRDWRVMLEKEGDRIDSISATVPNHMHAPIAVTAMNLGKHVYCQKPLTHSLFESRRMAEVAAANPELVTQMGVQTHSGVQYRAAVAMLQAGVIGKVKEAHSWDIVRFYYTGAFVDPPMRRRPDREDPVPEELDWDLWLGVAPKRPFVKDLYHTRWWRRWRDFGGGAQGDMAGHMLDPVFTALEIVSPSWVMSYRSPPFEETYSPNNKLHYRFPGTKYTAGDLDYFWYDTGEVDKADWPIDQKKKLPGDGSMLVGEQGYMYLPHGSAPEILPKSKDNDAIVKEALAEVAREADLDRYDGLGKKNLLQLGDMSDLDHYHQFVNACLGKGKTTTPFEYSGPLSESILMGTIVNRFPEEKLLWDGKALSFTNKPEANERLRRAYRDGWSVEGLG